MSIIKEVKITSYGYWMYENNKVDECDVFMLYAYDLDHLLIHRLHQIMCIGIYVTLEMALRNTCLTFRHIT